MAEFGKPNKTGRSSGKLDRADRKLLGPPEGGSWVWFPAELLASPAWHGMTLNGRRFVEFLMIEHCNHAGRENGNLRATYCQLVAYGIRRCKIRPAIDEAEARGLVETTRRGGLFGAENKRTASTFRLTWIGCVNPRQEPTNEWRHWRPQKTSPVPPVGTVSVPPVGTDHKVEAA